MKIYNEIITIFNDETQKWETLYEDSFDYNGPLLLAALNCEGCPPANGLERCGVEAPSNSSCCMISDAIDMRNADGQSLEFATWDWGYCGSNPNDWSLAMVGYADFTNFYTDEYGLSAIEFCCIPNNIKHIDFSASTSFTGAVPLCWTLNYSSPYAVTGVDTCTT